MEAKAECTQRLRAVTAVKLKKRYIHKVKYKVTILLNSSNINKADQIVGGIK